MSIQLMLRPREKWLLIARPVMKIWCEIMITLVNKLNFIKWLANYPIPPGKPKWMSLIIGGPGFV
jgi:hypothetical protein